MSLVWERAPYSEGSLLVLLALADWADDNGFSWPSIDGLAQKARLQRRRVQYIIRSLKADGILDIEEGGGRKKRNRYTLNLAKLNGALNAPFPEINSALGDVETVHFGAETVHSGTQTVHSSAPDPLEEPSMDPSVDPSVLEPPFSSKDFLTSLREFEAHRKEIHKPLKAMGRKKLYAQLKELGEQRSIAAIDFSISHGWTGVYEEKNGNGNGSRRFDRSDRNVDNMRDSLKYLDSLEQQADRKALHGD